MPLDSFVDIPPNSDFPLDNLPWGVFQRRCQDGPPAIGVALGDMVVDVAALQQLGLLSGPGLSGAGGACLQEPTLNAFMSMGQPLWREARTTLQRLLSKSEGVIRDDKRLQEQVLVPQSDVEMRLPADVGDYTDFYASRHHATNVGSMYRGPGNELNPNWVHLPVGYHGRSSSLICSGQPVRRPMGQVLPKDAQQPVFKTSGAVDFELEVGAFIGPGNPMGEPVPIESAADHVFGLVLLNDWSARDIQKWEYVPLGPFNAKNWATQISPWVVTLDAVEPFKCDAPAQDPPVLPYMHEPQRHTYDVNLTVDIVPAAHSWAARVTSSNLQHLYWTFPQMVAHHTCGGCPLRPGDLLGSGTISGPDPSSRGCLLELAWGGAQPLDLTSCPIQPSPSASNSSTSTGTTAPGSTPVQRVYLEDGDTVVMRGWCERGGVRVGFGECRGTLLPAVKK